MYRFQPETLTIALSVPSGTVSAQSHKLGLENAEPLIVAMDALLRYAKAYHAHCDSRLADDGVLGECWLDAAKGVRGLLNGDGAVAMELDRTTDSKDNGAVESMFWKALEIAGFEEKDI